MLSESTSSFSNNSENINDFSINHQIQGLPDIFSTPPVLTRAVLSKKRNSKDVFIQLDNKDFICRICHGGNSSGNLLTPCHCKGSIALAHMKCLEIWLNESNRNSCELCQYHFRIVREPKYGIFWSIFVFLRHPEDHFRELLVDIITLIVYTPSTVTSTYMLMLLCESLNKNEPQIRKTFLTHLMAFSAIFGIAAINFIYTSWLVLTVEKYVDYWRDWYKRNSSVRVILSATKINNNNNNTPTCSSTD